MLFLVHARATKDRHDSHDRTDYCGVAHQAMLCSCQVMEHQMYCPSVLTDIALFIAEDEAVASLCLSLINRNAVIVGYREDRGQQLHDRSLPAQLPLRYDGRASDTMTTYTH
jgi:hypothetical protein